MIRLVFQVENDNGIGTIIYDNPKAVIPKVGNVVRINDDLSGVMLAVVSDVTQLKENEYVVKCAVPKMLSYTDNKKEG